MQALTEIEENYLLRLFNCKIIKMLKNPWNKSFPP